MKSENNKTNLINSLISGTAILNEMPKLHATMHLLIRRQIPVKTNLVKEDWLPIANPSKKPSKHNANNNKYGVKEENSFFPCECP